jgi:hypothetical protein
MKLLTQKSLKTELRLKRYKRLKLQVLVCKITGARLQIEFETRGYTQICKKAKGFDVNFLDLHEL